MPIRKWQWWVVSHDRPRRKLCWFWEMMRFVDRCRDMCQGMLETLVCSFLRGQLWSPFKRCTNVGELPSRWQSSWIVRLLEKGREYNGEFWGGVTENSSWNQIWPTGFIDLNFQELLLNAFRREWYIRHTLIRRGGLPTLIQRLSDWPARENNRNFFHGKIVIYALVFPITMRLYFIVKYSLATFWTLFLCLLYFVGIFNVTRTGVVWLDVWGKVDVKESSFDDSYCCQ